MARVTIDSGALCAQDRFDDIPKERWRQLVSEKRNFLATRIKYDCRCLIDFCEEAEVVWQELSFDSAADMIRNGYELDPVEIDLAVAWLRHNEPQSAVGIDAIKAKVQEAREKPLADVGPPTKEEKDNGSVTTNTGRGVDYTLRRLARDAPEMLDKIEAGELSVNAAAIQAGIRKKPTHAEICVKSFRKTENRLEVLKVVVSTLEPYEAAIVRDWVLEKLQ